MEDKYLEYAVIVNEVLQLEKEISELLNAIVRPDLETPMKCNDFMQRGIYLQIYFDRISLAAFDEEKMKRVRELIGEYREKRVKQSVLENNVGALESVKKINKISVLGFGGQ
jgi:hypothetical protein